MGYKHQTTDAKRIKDLLESGCNVDDLAKAFGVSKAAITGWIKSDIAPLWTRIAVEAIERRRGKYNRKIIICEVNNATADIIMAIVKAAEGDLHVVKDKR